MANFRLLWLVPSTILILVLMIFSTGVFGIFYETAIASLLLLGILCVPVFVSGFQWYEPVCAMNAMFSLLGIAGLYFAYTGFSSAEHAVHGFQDFSLRAPLTILYVISWVLCFYLGYYLCRKAPVNFDASEPLVSPVVGQKAILLKVFSAVCFCLAFINTAYNVWLFNPESPWAYFTSFGVSKYREQVNEGVFTTLGYHFYIVGLILYRYSFSSWSWPRLAWFFLLLSFSLIAVLSRGQIFFTFSIVLFLFVLEYFLSNIRDRYISWAMALLPLFFLIVVVAYFSRLVSVEFFLAQKSGEDFHVLSSFWSKVSAFGSLIFGKGNVPNLPAMIVYEDHFGSIESYLLGESLISWLSAFLPFFDATYIGYGISDTWYPNNVGGIPPGVVHEMIANFGALGGLLAAVAFGAFSAFLFNFIVSKRSFVLFVIYSALLVRFWFILPKVEFSVLSNSVWLFLPTVVVFGVFSLVCRAFFSKQ